MTCIAVIPARGGSKRIPRKNVRPFHGKPILLYSIETAAASGLFRKILVSTDDAEIASIATQAGACIHMRPKELADDKTGTQAVMKNALQTLRLHDNDAGQACCIYATAPLMRPYDLQRGYDALLRKLSCYAFSVGTDPLQDAGQWYWGKISAFLNDVPLYDDRSVMVPIESARVCDINTESDWTRAEQMYISLRDGT